MKKVMVSLAVLVSSVLSVSTHAATFEQASMQCANAVQGQLMPNQSRAWGSEMLEVCQNGIKTAQNATAAARVFKDLEDARINAMSQSNLIQATEIQLAEKFFAFGLMFGGMSREAILAATPEDSGKAAQAAHSGYKASKMTCDAVVYDTTGDGPARKLQNHKRAATVVFHTDNSATVTVPYKNGSEYDGKPHSFETMPLNRPLDMNDDKASIRGDGDSFAFTPLDQNWDIVLENCR